MWLGQSVRANQLSTAPLTDHTDIAMIFKVALLALAITTVAIAEISKDEIKVDIFKRLQSPNDTLVQQEAKGLIAEFLAQTILGENVEDDEAVPYRRDNDHHHRERTRKPHRTRRPIIDHRDTSPMPEVPVANQPAAAAVNPAAPVDDTQTKQASTQIPIITGSAGAAAAPAVPAATAAPPAAGAVTAAPTIPTTRRTRPTVDPNHVYQQVDKILGNVASGNIVGIVDESLAIRAPTPVRNFVTGILKVIFCNPFDRLLGRCTPNSSGAISSVQGG